jgi:hypothetical protein
VTKPAYSYDELDEIFRGNGRSDGIGISLIDGLIAAAGGSDKLRRVLARRSAMLE